MKTIRAFLLAAFCAVLLAATGTAAADDMTWADLQQALNTGGTVSLDSDVIASASDEALIVPQGVTVTLDLNSHTINRGLSEVAENGSVIVVQGTLTVRDSGSGGTITGGFAELGGGIANNGTLIIEGGSIEGNCAVYDGGGIYNSGTLAMRGGTVTGNTAGRYGGGVLHNATLTMEGTPVVWDNTPSNLYLPEGKRIRITNTMNTGARIGITSPAFVTTFTEHYHDFAQAVPTAFFFSDVEGCRISQNGYKEHSDESHEGRWETVLTYLNVDRSGRRVTTLETNYTLLTSGSSNLTATWYVVRGDVTVNDRLDVKDSSSVNILLMDGAVLRAKDGIYVSSDSSLNIYGQSGETGQLIAEGSSKSAGIGGKNETGYGAIYIHSGRVQATGGSFGAGIGGGLDAANGSGLVTIYGGFVTAQGGEYGAGIGGGANDDDEPYYGDPGRIVIYGGTVNATGGLTSAGIGSGRFAKNRGSIEIHGGSVTAQGGNNGAGIGGGFGGDNDKVTVLITGGQVYAKGKGSGAGIGGGGGTGVDEGSGCKVTITGGTVTAVSSEHAIGKGGNQWSNHHTTLDIYDLAWVRAGSSEADASPVASGDRVSACRDSHYVRIEPCTHENATYTIEAATHTGTCLNCLREAIEEPHRFVEGICEACGYHTSNWVITFDPNGGTGTMPAIEVTPGSSVLLPVCSFRAPDGMAFVAWQIASDSYPAGSSFAPNAHFTALAVWGESTWSLLQEQINSAEDGKTVVLTADLTASASDATLEIPAGKRITLDLNGHTLSGAGELGTVLSVEGGAELTLRDTAGSGAVTRGKWYGIYVNQNSSFSMQDVEISSCGTGVQVCGTAVMSGGTILNCTDGGVFLDSLGSFTLTGGSIASNQAYSYTDGGGVTVNSGTFRMTGGSIVRNSGKSGGGVYVNTGAGHFIMEGGSINANTAPYGGGVYVSNSNSGGSVTLSGSATITGNTGTDGAAANLVLAKNSYGSFTHINMAAGSVSGRVGVTIRPYNSSDTDLTPAFTTGLNGRSVGGFVSDSTAYSVGLNDDGEACFINPNVLGIPDFLLPTGTLGIQSEAFVGIAATVVYIPNSCRSIGAAAFRDCPNLRQIQIPAGCTIGEDAFAGDFGLRIFGYRNSPAETYCSDHLYCIFVPLD